MSNSTLPRHLLLSLLMATCLTLGACEKTGKEHLREAGSAIAQKKPDLAEKSLAEALKKDPTLKNRVQRQQTRIHLLRKDYDKAEEVLLTAWKDGAFDKGRLETKQKQQKQLLSDLFTELYRTWAESMDAKQNPKKFEEVLTKGIKRDANDPRLNTMLVTFYFDHAEKLIQEKKKAEAADMLDKVYALRTTSKRRNQAKSRADNLRVEVYNETTLARFNTEIKPALVKAQLFDDTKDIVILLVEEEVDKRLRPGKEEDEKSAFVLAYKTMDTNLKAMVRKLHAFDEGIELKGRPKNVEIVEKKLERGKFTLKASVPLNDLIYYGRIMKKLHEKAAKPADKKGPKTDAKKGDKKGDAVKKDDKTTNKAAPKKTPPTKDAPKAN